MPDLTPPPMSEEQILTALAKIFRPDDFPITRNTVPVAGELLPMAVALVRKAEAHVNEQWRQRLEAIDYSRDWDVLYRIKEQG